MLKINLAIKPSYPLQLLLLFLHLGAAIAMCSSGINHYKFLMLSCILLSFIFNMRKFVWLSSDKAIIALQELADGDWQLLPSIPNVDYRYLYFRMLLEQKLLGDYACR
jgi:hypothetical protein